jgi:alkylhydroperoxidase family enzyme
MNTYTENPFETLEWSAAEHNAKFQFPQGVDPHTALAACRIAAALTKAGDACTATEVLSLRPSQFDQLQAWYATLV